MNRLHLQVLIAAQSRGNLDVRRDVNMCSNYRYRRSEFRAN